MDALHELSPAYHQDDAANATPVARG